MSRNTNLGSAIFKKHTCGYKVKVPFGLLDFCSPKLNELEDLQMMVVAGSENKYWWLPIEKAIVFQKTNQPTNLLKFALGL
ncbi:unnamed protein product [Cochlearia groenlandica]